MQNAKCKISLLNTLKVSFLNFEFNILNFCKMNRMVD